MEFEEIIENKSDDKIDLRNFKCSPTTVLPLLCECSNKSLKLDDGSSAFEFLESNLKTPNFSHLCLIQDMKVMKQIF